MLVMLVYRYIIYEMFVVLSTHLSRHVLFLSNLETHMLSENDKVVDLRLVLVDGRDITS